MVGAATAWLEHVDPGAHRRIKGLRLVTAYALAGMMGLLHALNADLPDRAALPTLAAGFALWASVSEGRTSRAASSRDLAALAAAATLGALALAAIAPRLQAPGRPGAELVLVSGAFLASYFKRFGVLGAGIGSQIYLGQLFAFGAGLTLADVPMILVAGVIAAAAAIVPRVLSGPAEHPVPAAPLPATVPGQLSPTLRMGLQAGAAALAIVLLNDAVGLTESGWAVTACTYVIAGTASATMERVWRRILGTAIGVPIALACLPLASHAPLVIWFAAAVAMVVYAMALPERYDIACGAFAFALIVTLAATGETLFAVLAARAWETVVGAGIGLATAMLLMPLRPARLPPG